MISSALSGRKVLVTGASGFLGSHLTQRLCKEGAEVHAVSRTRRESETGYLHWWKADIADIASARTLLNAVKPSVVYHLAGLSTAAPDFELVLPMFHSQLTSTVNVLTLATEIGQCRVVLPASLTEPEPGDVPPIPSSPYAAAKWAASGYARMFHQLYNLPVVLVRAFMTYGPGQSKAKIVPYVTLSLLQGEAPKLSSGNQQFDWIYIDDVVDGLLAAGEADNVQGCTIDLGSGVATSLRQVVEHLVDLIGPSVKPLFGAVPDRPFESVRVANVIDAYTLLHWRPKTSLRKGLEQTVEWYRRLPDPFRSNATLPT